MRTPISNTATNKSAAGRGAIVKHGVVMPDTDPNRPGEYLVYFGDRTGSAEGRVEDGLWASNALSPYTRFRDANNAPISFGSFIPLAPYTPVMCTFPNGGMGQPIITSLAKTNVNVPDPKNRDELYMVMQTPKGSWIALDDKKNNIQIMQNKGSSSIVLAEKNISLEIAKGNNSGKAHDTSLSISEGSFIFKMRDAMMKFDEGGFIVGFDSIEGNEHSSYFKVSRDGVEIYGNKYFKVNTDEYATINSREITIEGTKEASFLSNHIKMNGTQLTSIKGNQIELEAFWNVQIKGVHIGFQAEMKLTESTTMRQTTIAQESKAIGIFAEAATDHSITAAAYNLAATNILMDGIIVENSGAATTIATAAFSETLGVNEAVHEVLKEMGELFITKNVLMSTVTKILGGGTAMAGAAKTSENPGGILQITKDKENKKSINSVAATFYSRTNDAAENLTLADSLIEESLTALNTNGGSPSSLTQADNKSLFQAGITGQESTVPEGSVMGMQIAGMPQSLTGINIGGSSGSGSTSEKNSCVTATNSCNIMEPSGPFASMRKNIQGCDGHSGTGEPKSCGSTSRDTSAADEYKSVFGEDLLKSNRSGTSPKKCGH